MIESIDFAFVFARFCHFYSFTDSHVLLMPVARFWCMEKQIQRIKAEDTLRELSVESSKNDKDGVRRMLDSLTLELGETYQVVRPKFVKPEPGAGERLKALAR